MTVIVSANRAITDAGGSWAQGDAPVRAAGASAVAEAGRCRKLLDDLEGQVGALEKIARDFRQADLAGDDEAAHDAWRAGFSLLTRMNRTVAELKDCVRTGALTPEETARLGRVIERVKRAGDLAGLPVPDDLYRKAMAGDPGAMQKVMDILGAVGGGAKSAAQFVGQVFLLLLSLAGLGGGQHAT